jgi:glucose-6-phosphate isomerase
MKKLTELAEWKALSTHFPEMANCRLGDLFVIDPNRSSTFSSHAAGLFLDFSRNLATEETLKLLCQLAEARDLSNKINDLFNGDAVNSSEFRPALHSALRDFSPTPIIIDQKNVDHLVKSARDATCQFVNLVHENKITGITGKPFTHVVNIGIGGSHLGPLMTIHALKEFAIGKKSFHFLSTVDKAQLDDVWSEIDPEATLFIISSKSFATIETLTNARTLVERMKDLYGQESIQRHFVAITAAKERALAFGISEDKIFPMWDWVGGRYSIWSAIGLPLQLMIGNQAFADFLTGAYEMDTHFRQTPFEKTCLCCSHY